MVLCLPRHYANDGVNFKIKKGVEKERARVVVRHALASNLIFF